jgi:glutamate carboxypeptidase
MGPRHAAVLGLLLLAAPAPALRAEPSAEELELKIEIDLHREEMIDTLREWVDLNTGSFNLVGLEEFATLLPERLTELGFKADVRQGLEVELPDRGEIRTGPLVIARRPAQASGAPRFLLVGHYDTVFEPDSPFQKFSVDPALPSRAYGPGAADMKGGLVILLYALRALHAHGELDRASWVVVLNGDEEIGSLGSRALIEAEASEADYGFVFESTHKGGAMVRSRRGLGQFHLRVTGVAAHAGNAHRQGRSAIRTLAERVLEIEALTDYERGVTLNVGTIAGGTKRNIVPERAVAWIDLRYDDSETGEQTRLQLEEIAARSSNGTQAELWGTLHRPPKPETPEVAALLERHRAVASDLGVELPEALHSGGGTDGSLMGAVGLPTLDSVGAVGGGAHTTGEYVELDALTDRAAIAAILLRRLARAHSLRPAEPAVD